MSTTPIMIAIMPVIGTPGRYEAWLGRRLLIRSPVLDSARVLIAEGYLPKTVLEARRPGRSDWDLRVRIGVAAALDVRETANGPAFRPFVAPQSLLAAPPIVQKQLVHTRAAGTTTKPMSEATVQTTDMVVTSTLTKAIAQGATETTIVPPVAAANPSGPAINQAATDVVQAHTAVPSTGDGIPCSPVPAAGRPI
jgi:hypothetical protein